VGTLLRVHGGPRTLSKALCDVDAEAEGRAILVSQRRQRRGQRRGEECVRRARERQALRRKEGGECGGAQEL
jgi:hypothetical protein